MVLYKKVTRIETRRIHWSTTELYFMVENLMQRIVWHGTLSLQSIHLYKCSTKIWWIISPLNLKRSLNIHYFRFFHWFSRMKVPLNVGLFLRAALNPISEIVLWYVFWIVNQHVSIILAFTTIFKIRPQSDRLSCLSARSRWWPASNNTSQH